MDIQTAAMREMAGPEKEINYIRHEDGTFSAIEYVNHPTPSGSERWLPTVSGNLHWPTQEKAKEEFEKLLARL